MWFKKSKKQKDEKIIKKDDEMSKIIDEVLSEKAEEKEAAMRESAEDIHAPQTQTEGIKSTAELIEAFIANQNNDTYKAVIDALVVSTPFVPMTPVEGSENKEEKTTKFSPSLVQSPNGEKLFPVFSDKSQIPEEYAKKFSSVAMPFGAACELASKIPDCDKLIVNPFTKAFVINKEFLDNAAKAIAEQREKNNNMVEFSTPEPEVKVIAAKFAAKFNNIPEIKQAHFSKMKRQNKISYALIIDCPENGQQATFEKIVEILRADKVALPIAFLPYKGLEKVVAESKHIEKVY